MTGFFEQLATQSALGIDGNLDEPSSAPPSPASGEAPDIEVVEMETTENAAAPAASLPDSPPSPSPPSADAERPPESPEPAAEGVAEPEDPDSGQPAPLQEVREEVVELPSDSSSAKESSDKKEAREEPPQATIQAVLRWIAGGEEERPESGVPAHPESPQSEARHPQSSVEQEEAPPAGARDFLGEPYRESGDTGGAANPAEASQPVGSEPPPPPSQPAPVPKTPESDEARSRSAGENEPDFPSAPSVTIGSIQVTVDAGQSPAPAPRKPASSPGPVRPAKANSAMYLRRHYIVPH